MVFLGEASFAFYLLHAPILGLLDFGEPSSFDKWILITIAEFVIVMLTAIGAHIAIELPAQRCLRGTLDRRKTQTIQAVSAKI